MDNSDLIGKKFTNADGRLFEVEAVNPEYPSVVEVHDRSTGQRGCMLADFVRPNLVTPN
jgi:hypothetical protein